MYRSLTLKQFRSYTDYSLELSPGVNIIVGPNASGKTNLLESIYFVSQTKPFRGQRKEIIQDNKDWTRVDAIVDKDLRTIKFQPPKQAELNINDKIIPRKERWQKQIPIVLFDPEDLRLLRGSPKRRRDFLDEVLTQSDQAYSENLVRYNRALAQRNKLLKKPNLADDELFVWDIKLAEHGSVVVAKRKEFVELLNKKLTKLYSTIAGSRQKVKCDYLTNGSNKNTMLKSLHKTQNNDYRNGFTSVGPHRDDIEFIINKTEAKSHASRGETRSLVLALKMVEEEIVRKAHGIKPIMLLDDVFSELDASRRRHLTEYFKDHQVIITTTDADAVIEHFSGGDYKIIPMKSG